MLVVKRDGQEVTFDRSKIELAVIQAGARVRELPKHEVLKSIYCEIENSGKDTITIPEVQEIVERNLMTFQPRIGETYISYRKARDLARRRSSSKNKDHLDSIVNIKGGNYVKENANMAGATPTGQMMKFASLGSTDYTIDHLLPEKYRELHESGDIHIHDLDYYACKTRTCVQYNMESLFEGGFWTDKTGVIDEPQRIQSYADLAAIIFQTQQNLDHGGQSAPAFDFFMAPGVIKSFNFHLNNYLKKFVHYEGEPVKLETIEYSKFDIARVARQIGSTPVEIADYFKHSYDDTFRDTEQAMQGFIHNMNMMHSRGGNQVVFSSINYGTDTSPEGRLVMDRLLKVTEDGIGQHGKTPIFPIQIFKIKSGVTFSFKDWDAWRASKLEGEELVDPVWEAPNFDLFIRSLEVSSKRLFPNFMNLDVDFNTHELWRADDPKRWYYEPATMGKHKLPIYANVI